MLSAGFEPAPFDRGGGTTIPLSHPDVYANLGEFLNKYIIMKLLMITNICLNSLCNSKHSS